MVTLKKIVPCLWFDGQAEEAAKYYCDIFGQGSRITKVTHYGKAGQEHHKRPVGAVLAVEFELRGSPFLALNAGPEFKFTQAVSFMVMCETQPEIDDMWAKLTAGGQEIQCSWLKDKYGLAWQVVPTIMPELVGDANSEKSQRARAAMMGMVKLDIAALKKAYDGA